MRVDMVRRGQYKGNIQQRQRYLGVIYGDLWAQQGKVGILQGPDNENDLPEGMGAGEMSAYE